MEKLYHMSIDVRGALKNWTARESRGCRNASGSRMTLLEIKELLMDHLAAGHEVIPFGRCDNFDWRSGCQGHAR